ncbi:DUF262 domain-containing protein [Pseudomonas sp. DE0157]|uniref:DUF262 domain-containing protein n=1 Tax=Pseudomonas sp. DE0157 TaxID=2584952 RepID=UPI0011A7C16F|nr:DUF262 domain-containing protein [Pseudomonas sp. DE0157]
MNRNLTTQDVSWFLDMNDRGQLNLNPPYQRRSVWSPRDKRFFIDTILNNYPAPPIFLHKTLQENGKATYHVVDGKQRLQTIIDFTAGKIRIPDDFADINLQKKRWKDLDKSTREIFWNYVLIVEMVPEVSDAAIRNTFERINRNSRKLTPQEMRHAKYDGWFISFVEAEASQNAWKSFGIVTTARTKRMADVQFISELFAVTLKNKIFGFDQDFLDELYAEYEEIEDNDSFIEEDFYSSVSRVKDFISEMLREVPEVREYLKVQIHLYSLWAYLNQQDTNALEPKNFAVKYIAFMRQATNQAPTSADEKNNDKEAVSSFTTEATSYASSSKGATTDLTPRAQRHEALVSALSTK